MPITFTLNKGNRLFFIKNFQKKILLKKKTSKFVPKLKIYLYI